MVVHVTVTHVFKHPFEYVARTHFNKYPNEKEKMVIGVETIEQRSDSITGTVFKKRVALCHNIVPSYLRQFSFLQIQHIKLEELSWLNYRDQSLHLSSRNLTWATYADMKEQSHFRPHAENPKWTVLDQSGSIEVKGLGLLGSAIEIFAKAFLQQGVRRALHIMDDLLDDSSLHSSKSGPGIFSPHYSNDSEVS